MRIADAAEAHLEGIAAIYAAAVADSPATFDLEAPSVERWRATLGKTDPAAGHLFLVALGDADEVLGYAKTGSHREKGAYRTTVETSVYVAETARRRGVAHALYAELLRRLEAGPARLAVAGLTEPNVASARLHEAHGFTPVGTFHGIGVKFARAWDVTWYERPLGRPGRGGRSTLPAAVRIFSGIQPTGRKHLGNYIGAIRQYVTGQDRGEGIYCIVDLHAITVPYDPAELRERTLDTAAILLAAGLDPRAPAEGGSGCILFRQGDVQEHTELTWLLSSVTALGELNRMHQFRDKSAAQRELVSAGLLFYPVLMAADVLAYRAHEVPVGEDQREHLELMRDIARRFNQRFGDDVLVVPEQRIPPVGARIMDLQAPERKMSTTGGTPQGTVLVLDEPKTVVKKVKSAVTDSGSEVVRGPGKPGISNLIEIVAAIREWEPEEVEREFAEARYGDFKTKVADEVVEYLRPVRERYGELRDDPAELERTLARGAEKAREMAAETLADVRAVMGVGAPS